MYIAMICKACIHTNLQAEHESNYSKYEEAEEKVDNGWHQVIIGLLPVLRLSGSSRLSNNCLPCVSMIMQLFSSLLAIYNNYR